MNIHAAPEGPVKAVICTIYGTLLECGAPPADAEQRWFRLWREQLQRPPRISLSEFNRAADLAVQTETNILSVRGVENPAPYWPAIAELLLPELRDLSDASAAAFLYTHAQLRRSVRLSSGAGEALRAFHGRGVHLGLISNGHPHTPVELALALRHPDEVVAPSVPVGTAGEIPAGEEAAGKLAIFTRPLCFWSYAHGFGKPNLHAFQHVATRLCARRISASEVLMIGCDWGSDLMPARRFGWRTWLIAPGGTARPGTGSWPELTRAFDLNPSLQRVEVSGACTI
jgi:FMN phosphatase YigB (HAD superfamily)